MKGGLFLGFLLASVGYLGLAGEAAALPEECVMTPQVWTSYQVYEGLMICTPNIQPPGQICV